MEPPALKVLMRRFRRRGSRGLAEIVGTLMLVVIVVAAATAFSFFVASYQKQLQAEETLSHDRALEDVKVISVTEVSCSVVTCASGAATDSFADVSFVVASLDVNTIVVTGLFLNGHGVVNFSATYTSNDTSTDPCYNASAHVAGHLTSGLVPCVPIPLRAFSSVEFTLNLDQSGSGAYAFGGTDDQVLPTSDLSFQVVTQLTNLFTETFAPPDAIASVFFVSSGGTTVPVFDGLDSYQPTSANNASILWYNWTIMPTAQGPATTSSTVWSGMVSYAGVGSCSKVTVSNIILGTPLGTATGGFVGPATVLNQSCPSGGGGDTLYVNYTIAFSATAAGSLTGANSATIYYNDSAGTWTGSASGYETPAGSATLLNVPTDGISGSASISAHAGVGYDAGTLEVTGLTYAGATFNGFSVGAVSYSGGLGGTFDFTYHAGTYIDPGDAAVPSEVAISWEYAAACSTNTGPELECAGLASGVAYLVSLTVTDTDGLLGATTISYTQP